MLARLLAALFTLAGAAIQMRLALRQIAASHREGIQRKGAEDDLVKELQSGQRAPIRKRQRVRREFVRDREPELHRTIRETWMHLWSWVLPFGAAAAVVANELLQL